MKKTTVPNHAAEEREDDHAPVWLDGESDGTDGDDAQPKSQARAAEEQGGHRHGAVRPDVDDARGEGGTQNHGVQVSDSHGDGADRMQSDTHTHTHSQAPTRGRATLLTATIAIARTSTATTTATPVITTAPAATAHTATPVTATPMPPSQVTAAPSHWLSH